MQLARSGQLPFHGPKVFMLITIALILGIGQITAMFAALPISMLFLLYGRKVGWFSAIAATMVCFFLASAGYVPAFMIGSLPISTLLAFTVSEFIRNQVSPSKGMLLAGFSSFIAACLIGGVYIYNLDKKVKIPTHIPEVKSSYKVVENFKGFIYLSLKDFGEQVMSEQGQDGKLSTPSGAPEFRVIMDILRSPQIILDRAIISFPSGLFVGVFLWIWLNLYMVLRLNRVYPFRNELTEKDLLNFKVPEQVVFVFIALLVFTLVGDYLFSGPTTEIGQSLLQCLGVFYFFQGFGIYINFLDFMKFHGFLRVVLVLFTVFTGSWFIAGVGLFDLWFNFRKYFKRNDPNGHDSNSNSNGGGF